MGDEPDVGRPVAVRREVRRPGVGERVVVFSWTREQVGRRYETSAAMVDARGEVIARADATWIAARRQRLAASLGGRR